VSPRRPIGYFVHHQGRGHVERCAAIVAALPIDRPVTVFCARPDALPALGVGVEVVETPSLFEPTGAEAAGMDHVPLPDTLHCAPLGWPGIRTAMRRMVEWFDRADPALMVCDVSAEVAQLARLCSVPHVKVLQHGRRDDPGHRAAYAGAAGILVPFDRRLTPDDWPEEWLPKSCFAGGLGASTKVPERRAARERLGIGSDERVHLIVVGGGGEGFASAALGVGARTFPDASWHTIGPVRGSWHATEPANLVHHGWVDDPLDHLAAADLIVSSAGNTVCQQVLAVGRPWIVVPEWSYFDEQSCKARALGEAALARVEPHLPSHAAAWRRAVTAALACHDATRQRAAIRDDADRHAADWLDGLCVSLWGEETRDAERRTSAKPDRASVLTIARGRETHLANLVRGLERQRRAPAELVVGVMQETPYEALPRAGFPIRQILVESADGTLPLAAARNAVARRASEDTLIFLDVDCIPGPDFVADYADHVARLGAGAGLLMGEVLYLPDGSVDDGWTFETLEARGVRHDDRAGPPATAVKHCDDYRCFWSLNFAMRRDDFIASGGFDERYVGYGGEDTDFGRTLAERGVPISWVRGGRAFHQFHEHRMPPVHQLESVVRNAERFADKWGHRTMDHWLHCFGLMGLIEDTPEGIRILRAPTDMDASLCAPEDDRPYASTRRAMALLEARAEASYRHEHGTAPPDGWLDRKRFLHRPSARPASPGTAAS